MKKFTILLICLLSIVSCEKSETEIVDMAQDPEILETIDLTDEIGQPPFDFASFTPHYLPDNTLLLYCTDPSPVSTVYKYDLTDGSTLKWDENIHSDLRYSSKVISDNELFIISRDEEVFSINIEDLTTVENEPITTISNHFIKTDNFLFYKDLENSQLNIIEYDIANKVSEAFYTVNQATGVQYDSPLQFDIYTTSDSEIGLFVINYFEDKYYLENYNITKRELIWSFELDEFDIESDQLPNFVKYHDDKILIFGNNHMSCRDAKSGQSIWTHSKELSSELTPAAIYQDKIINVSADKIEAYNLNDGSLEWEIVKYGENGLGLGWENLVNISNMGDYLFINHYPVNIKTGDLLWTKSPELNWGNFDYSFAQPAIDIENEFLYFVTNHTLYKLKLPEIK